MLNVTGVGGDVECIRTKGAASNVVSCSLPMMYVTVGDWRSGSIRYDGIHSGMALGRATCCDHNPLAFDAAGESIDKHVADGRIRNAWYDPTCCPPRPVAPANDVIELSFDMRTRLLQANPAGAEESAGEGLTQSAPAPYTLQAFIVTERKRLPD